MKNFILALDAITTQVWAGIFIFVGAALLLAHKDSSPGHELLGAGLVIFRAEKGQ